MRTYRHRTTFSLICVIFREMRFSLFTAEEVIILDQQDVQVHLITSNFNKYQFFCVSDVMILS